MHSAKLFYFRFIYICFGIVGIVISCNNKRAKNDVASAKILTVILIQPLGSFNDSLAIALKTEIENTLPVRANLMKAIKLPANAWFAPRHRYWADSILKVLKPLYNVKNSYTLGITESDISTQKGLEPNWAVMGLALQPGTCCIVSTYRLYKYPQTQKQLLDKLVKVCLHELGHNVGLAHCKNTYCLMTDAKGRDILDNENNFCKLCRKKLASKGLEPKHSFIF